MYKKEAEFEQALERWNDAKEMFLDRMRLKYGNRKVYEWLKSLS